MQPARVSRLNGGKAFSTTQGIFGKDELGGLGLLLWEYGSCKSMDGCTEVTMAKNLTDKTGAATSSHTR